MNISDQIKIIDAMSFIAESCRNRNSYEMNHDLLATKAAEKLGWYEDDFSIPEIFYELAKGIS